MSYTTERQPQGYPYYFTNKIREAMIGELIAINDYTCHIANSDNKEINEVWYHIMEDEKRHYGMLLELLRRYDKVQYDKFKEAKEHVDLEGEVKELTYSPQYTKELTLNQIRKDIKGELEAIILYEQHVIEIPYPDIKMVLDEIIGDEKEHVEELTLLLMKYDKNKYGPIDDKC